MGQSCRACEHPQRDEIDEAIARGRNLRQVAREFGLSKDGVRRHKEAHVSRALVRIGPKIAREAGENRQAESILSRMERLYGRIEGLLDRAEEDGKAATMLQAARELRATGELLARITGEVRATPQQVTNVLLAPEWLRVRAAVLEALEPHPEARDGVVARLAALDGA